MIGVPQVATGATFLAVVHKVWLLYLGRWGWYKNGINTLPENANVRPYIAYADSMCNTPCLASNHTYARLHPECAISDIAYNSLESLTKSHFADVLSQL